MQNKYLVRAYILINENKQIAEQIKHRLKNSLSFKTVFSLFVK